MLPWCVGIVLNNNPTADETTNTISNLIKRRLRIPEPQCDLEKHHSSLIAFKDYPVFVCQGKWLKRLISFPANKECCLIYQLQFTLSYVHLSYKDKLVCIIKTHWTIMIKEKKIFFLYVLWTLFSILLM